MQVFNALKFKRLSKNLERRFAWVTACRGRFACFRIGTSSPCERSELPKIKKAAITDCLS